MLVCAHGDVENYCEEHGFTIAAKYDGDLEKYNGAYKVLITDVDVSKYEFYYLKGKLFASGVELVSVRYDDNAELIEFSEYFFSRNRREKSGGRQRFGYYNDNGVKKLHDTGRDVLKRIFELRDAGYSYGAISRDDKVHHLNGKKLSISAVSVILHNREKYEKEGL